MTHSLWHLLHPDVDQKAHETMKFPRHDEFVSFTVCNGTTRVVRVYADYFTASRESPVRFRQRPWLSMLPAFKPDVLVLNSGIHPHPRGVAGYEQDVAAVTKALARFRGRIVFRTTPAGHPDCHESAQPVLGAAPPPAKEFPGRYSTRYKWHVVDQQNAVAVAAFQKIGALVLDVEPLTWRRPDSHKAPLPSANGPHPKTVDCLHYTLPGPIDTWNWLLLNALAGRIE